VSTDLHSKQVLFCIAVFVIAVGCLYILLGGYALFFAVPPTSPAPKRRETLPFWGQCVITFLVVATLSIAAIYWMNNP
jgi:uncharacterized membrane protein YidH (DUF202 family)